MIQSLFLFFFCNLVLISSCLDSFQASLPNTLSFPQEDFYHECLQLQQGAEWQEAGLYIKAIEAYQSLLHELEAKDAQSSDLTLAMQARFYLAYAYFSQKSYQESVDVLEKNISQTSGLSAQQEQIRRHSLYLYALSLKHLDLPLDLQLEGSIKEGSRAKAAFLSYLQLPAPPSLTFREEALFERARLDFLEGNIQEAALHFKSLSHPLVALSPSDPLKQCRSGKLQPEDGIAQKSLSILAQLYLARIAQMQGNDLEAANILKPLQSQLSPDDPLLLELYYLQGKTAFNQREYSQAIQHLTNVLPLVASKKPSWYPDALTQLGWSYLRTTDKESSVQAQQALAQAENIFQKRLEISPDENGYLGLAQCYLSRAKQGKQPEYLTKAEDILSEPKHFTSKESQAQALLLRAEAAPTYIARDQLYRKFIDETEIPSAFYAQGWYLYALNDFEHGLALLASNNEHSAQHAFSHAEKGFEKAYTLLKEKEPRQSGAALKYQALSASYSKTPEGDLKAFQLLNELIYRSPTVWKEMESRDEIYYLHGFFADKLAKSTGQEKYLAIAEESLKAADSIPDSNFGDKSLHHLAALYYQNGDYAKAEETYLKLAEQHPKSGLAAEAWLWAARCADELHKDPQIGKQRKQYAFENFPPSPYTAEANFTYYSYPEYIQGDKNAIKHLRHFIDHYRDTPFLLDAYFLMGLDYKRDRKTVEGKWIRKKSLTEAIDSFQKSEILFDELSEKKLIPQEKLDYYIALRYRATLERALANLAIANEAQGAKQQIYLDYAEEVFKELHAKLHDHLNPHTPILFRQNNFPLIEEESSFWLAKTYAKSNKDEEAGNVLTSMRDRYKQQHITKGYYLARTLDELGILAMKHHDFSGALQHFKAAEEANKGQALSTHQKLDLWIRESLCYRELKQFDDAILILSRVINDDAISDLRLKAMYLRAETYELQKRPELARKQLESMVKKGGPWAKKAQEKLDKEYFNE